MKQSKQQHQGKLTNQTGAGLDSQQTNIQSQKLLSASGQLLTKHHRQHQGIVAVDIFNQNKGSLPKADLLPKRTFQQQTMLNLQQQNLLLQKIKNRSAQKILGAGALTEYTGQNQNASPAQLQPPNASQFQKYVQSQVEAAGINSTDIDPDLIQNVQKLRRSRVPSFEPYFQDKKLGSYSVVQQNPKTSQNANDGVLNSSSQRHGAINISQTDIEKQQTSVGTNENFNQGKLITRNEEGLTAQTSFAISSEKLNRQGIDSGRKSYYEKQTDPTSFKEVNSKKKESDRLINRSDSHKNEVVTVILAKDDDSTPRYNLQQLQQNISDMQQSSLKLTKKNQNYLHQNQSMQNLSNQKLTQKLLKDTHSKYLGTHVNLRSIQHVNIDRSPKLSNSIESKSSKNPRRQFYQKTNSKINMRHLKSIEQGKRLAQYVEVQKYMSQATNSGRLFLVESSDSQVSKMQNNLKQSMLNAQKHDSQRKIKAAQLFKNSRSGLSYQEEDHQLQGYNSVKLIEKNFKTFKETQLDQDSINRSYRYEVVPSSSRQLQNISRQRVTGSFNQNYDKQSNSDSLTFYRSQINLLNDESVKQNTNNILPGIRDLGRDTQNNRQNKVNQSMSQNQLHAHNHKLANMDFSGFVKNQSYIDGPSEQHYAHFNIKSPHKYQNLNLKNQSYTDLILRMNSITNPLSHPAHQFLKESFGSESKPINNTLKPRAISLLNRHSSKKQRIDMMHSELALSDAHGSNQSPQKSTILDYSFQKLKFEISQDQQDRSKALKIKDVLTRKNMAKMGGTQAFRSQISAKQQLLCELDGNSHSSKQIGHVKQMQNEAAQIEQSSYTKRMAYEQKRQFRQFKKESFVQDPRVRCSDSNRSKSSQQNNQNTLVIDQEIGSLSYNKIGQDVNQKEGQEDGQNINNASNKIHGNTQYESLPNQKSSLSEFASNPMGTDRSIMEIFIDKYDMEQYQQNKNQRLNKNQEAKNNNLESSPASTNNPQDNQKQQKQGLYLGRNHKLDNDLMLNNQMTPAQKDRHIDSTYDQIFTPEQMKQATGMPEHKVQMFDRSSRLSDSITERIIEQETINNLSRSDGPSIQLRDKSFESNKQPNYLDHNLNLANQNENQQISRDTSAIKLDLKNHEQIQYQLSQFNLPASISMSQEDVMNLLIQMELKKPKKNRSQILNKVQIADRRKITQEKLKMGKQIELKKVQQFVKEFQTKHLQIRDQQRMIEAHKVSGKQQSPKVKQKQEFLKQKQLANKYTINKKEWVLNQNDGSQSINSADRSISPALRNGEHSFQRKKVLINPQTTTLNIEDQSKSLEITEESKLIYLKKKQQRQERKRDKQFKKILNIFKESKKRRQMMKRKHIQNDQFSPTQSPQPRISHQRNNSIQSPQRNIDLELQLEPGPQSIQDFKQNEEPSVKSQSSKPSSVKMPESDIFLKEDDLNEAFEYNNIDLPEEYLLAKLALTNDHAVKFKKIQAQKQQKYELRRNTEFNFAKPDTFNDSNASIHDVVDSDKPSILSIDEGLNHILQEFQQKTEFLKEVKYTDRNQNKEISQSRQLHQTFVKSTNKYMDVPMPVLLKIKNGTLILPSVYSITEGVSVAIADSLSHLDGLNETKLLKAMFIRNGMSDQVFSNVLKGIRARREFGRLVSVANDIGNLAATQICALLERINENPEIPYVKRMPDLIELKLQSSKATPRAMDIIIQSFNNSPCLKRLSLSNMNLSDRQQKLLFDYIRDCSLQYLDISWNKLTSVGLAQLFQALENNLTLEWLDMSFIQMGPGDAHQETLEKHFDKFCKFLKENQKLIHLNLTSCSIPEKYMLDLICFLKRSQSLHCVHLCGNQLTNESVDLMSSKLKPTYINQMAIDPTKKLFKNALLNKIEKDITSVNSKKQYQKVYGSIKLKDAMMRWLSVQEQYQHSQVEDENFMPLILSKQLGHPEIRNSKHWKITNECFMCDKWKYTLIFWDLKNQGDPYQIKNPFLEDMIEDMIHNSNDRFSQLMSTNSLGSNAKAFITGSFTDWQPRRMMQIEELLAHYQGKQDALKSRDNMREFSNIIKEQWKRVLKRDVPYKHEDTQWVNLPDDFMFTTANPPEMDFNQLFVYCDFIKPGKHQYIVTYENTIVEDEPMTEKSERTEEPHGTFDIYKKNKKKEVKQEPKPVFQPHIEKTKLTSYHEFFSLAFMSNYNINTKVNEFDSIDRKFDKNKSVFKDWKLDKEKLVKEGFQDEISYWNVPNFVKDESEQQQISKFMIDNAVFLKTYFIIHSSNSSLPVIKWLYYAPMVTDWDIFDKVFTQADVDRIFIAVKNLKQELRGKVSESDMNRFQFYESIVRIAMNKYKNQGLTDTVYEGVVKLVREVLRPRYNNYLWMGWREDNLWTLEVDDLYKTNLTALQKLYKYFFKQKKTNTFFLEDAVDMFCNQVQLDLLPELITQAWGLSKMTINNDIKHRDQYYKAAFVEFLEFFARVADIKFKDGSHKNEKLITKIQMLMDMVFPLVQMKRKEVKIEIEYVSVSEEELIDDKYFM